jgi:subtilisin family serine protease
MGFNGGTPGADMKVYNAWNIQTNGTSNPNMTEPNIVAAGNFGDPKVIVAIIDCGVHNAHTDLGPNLEPGFDATGANPPSTLPLNNNSHGTHLAGIATAVRQSVQDATQKKVVGVAPLCRFMPVRIHTDLLDYNEIVSAVNYVKTQAINNNANTGKRYVILIGWNVAQDAQVTQEINNALSNNVVVVCAAGNGGGANAAYPASIPGVISVGATDYFDHRRSTSNLGAIYAPGDTIKSTIIGTNSFDDYSGTSQAAAFIAGAAAALWSRDYKIANPNPDQFTRTAAQIAALITSNYDTVDAPNNYHRHNLMNAIDNII